jgi:hypothetical protein
MHGGLLARRSLTRIARTGLAPLLFGIACPPRRGQAMSSSVAPEVDALYPVRHARAISIDSREPT